MGRCGRRQVRRALAGLGRRHRRSEAASFADAGPGEGLRADGFAGIQPAIRAPIDRVPGKPELILPSGPATFGIPRGQTAIPGAPRALTLLHFSVPNASTIPIAQTYWRNPDRARKARSREPRWRAQAAGGRITREDRRDPAAARHGFR